MPKILKSALQLIGETPVLELSRLSARYQCKTNILAKLEMWSPSGSVKDRAVHRMVREALETGKAAKTTLMVEASGGNSGISLAMVCAAMGLRCAVIVPDDTPVSRQNHIRMYGAQVIPFPASLGVEGAQSAVSALQEREPDSFVLRQFENPATLLAHRQGIGREIVDSVGRVDYFVAGSGSGATISGVGEVLKMHWPECRVIAVEPVDSPVLSGGFPGGHVITGIGPGFVPENLNTFILDEVIRVRTPDSVEMMQALAREEGILAGLSSGAALVAAVSVAQRVEAKGRTVLTILPDTGERYLKG